MKDAIFRVAVTTTLYVLAAPVYAAMYVLRVLRSRRIEAMLRHGSILCPYDATPIPLARMNTCACGYVSPSALVLVPCEFCGAIPEPSLVQCPTCGATIRAEVP